MGGMQRVIYPHFFEVVRVYSTPLSPSVSKCLFACFIAHDDIEASFILGLLDL